jgi:hypothetical protein
MTDILLAVLREGFEGPGPKVTFFLDGGPDAGLRNTLAQLSAEEASRPSGGNSVASHARHLAFSFEAFGAYVAGDRTSRNWDESWNVTTVDDASWRKLQDEIAAGYADLRAKIKEHAGTAPEATGGSIAAITHLAYHIGAIRQKIAALRASA